MGQLFSNISFMGGIHGVGKSTICKNLCTDLNIQYLSASEVLKWTEMNEDVKNKKVQDIPLTQDRLINGLIKRVEKQHHYLLDGHYCLLDKTDKVIRIPFETFDAFNPVSLHLIIGNIAGIKSRLELRDQRAYEFNLLEYFQDQEIEYAKEIAYKMNIDLSIGKEKDYSSITSVLKKYGNN